MMVTNKVDAKSIQKMKTNKYFWKNSTEIIREHTHCSLIQAVQEIMFEAQSEMKYGEVEVVEVWEDGKEDQSVTIKILA